MKSFFRSLLGRSTAQPKASPSRKAPYAPVNVPGDTPAKPAAPAKTTPAPQEAPTKETLAPQKQTSTKQSQEKASAPKKPATPKRTPAPRANRKPRPASARVPSPTDVAKRFPKSSVSPVLTEGALPKTAALRKAKLAHESSADSPSAKLPPHKTTSARSAKTPATAKTNNKAKGNNKAKANNKAKGKRKNTAITGTTPETKPKAPQTQAQPTPQTKPQNDKPEDTKAEVKQPTDKKPVDKTPVEKKPAEQKPNAATEAEISRALSRRSVEVGTLSARQRKTATKASLPVNDSARSGELTVEGASASAVATTAPAAQPSEHEPDALAVPAESKEVKKNRRARLRQVKGLDGLRGLAVLAVILYHFFQDFLPGGYLGVDMFFVLSGFLITSLLVREFRVNGRISLKDFWVRRFRRILPAAVTVLTLCTALVAALGGDLAVGIREQFLGTLFFVNNWTQIATSQSYFADNEIQVFAHYWSLAVEEQFYVFWPLIMVAVFVMAKRWPRRAPIVVSVVLALASVAAMWALYVPGEDPTRVYYGTDTHAFGLLCGAILSLLMTSTSADPKADSWPSAGKTEARVATVVGTLAFVAYVAQLIWMTATLDFTYRGGLLLTSILGSLMIWGVARERGPLTVLFRTGVMRWLGQRSFSLYLWHWPVIMILRALFDGNHNSENPWILGLVAVPISFGLAELSYQFVENPFRRGGYKKTWKQYWSSRPSAHELLDSMGKVLWPLAPILVVASLVGVGYALVTSNDKSELEQELEKLQQLNQDANQEAAGGAAKTQPRQAPAKARALPEGPDITAVGDSVMLAASQALSARYPGIYIDADVSRHYTAAISILEQLKDSGQLRSTVFLGFGTNGAAFPDQMAQIVDLLGPDRTIVLAVPYGERDWMNQARKDVVDAAAKYDNVYLADWCGAAQANPALLYSDGVHPLPESADSYAQVFADALEQYSTGDKNLSTQCQLG